MRRGYQCNISDISLEYDVISNEPYATIIGEMYGGENGTSIPYTKVNQSIIKHCLKKIVPGRLM